MKSTNSFLEKLNIESVDSSSLKTQYLAKEKECYEDLKPKV